MRGSRTLYTLAGCVTTTTAFSPDDQSGVTRDGRPLLKYPRRDSNPQTLGSEPSGFAWFAHAGLRESPIVTHRRGCICPLSTGPVGDVYRGAHPGIHTYSWLHAPRFSSLVREVSLNGPASLGCGTGACVDMTGFEPALDGISGRCLSPWATYPKYLWPDSNRHSADFEAARFAVSAHRHEPPPAI